MNIHHLVQAEVNPGSTPRMGALGGFTIDRPVGDWMPSEVGAATSPFFSGIRPGRATLRGEQV